MGQGPAVVAELAALEARFSLAAELTARRTARGMTRSRWPLSPARAQTTWRDRDSAGRRGGCSETSTGRPDRRHSGKPSSSRLARTPSARRARTASPAKAQ